MSFYTCPVCNAELFNTTYYNTPHGTVCEDCYESRKGTESDYEKFKNNLKEY